MLTGVLEYIMQYNSVPFFHFSISSDLTFCVDFLDIGAFLGGGGLSLWR